MADSSTYTPETLQRRYAMAQALLADPKTPIKHWAEGLNELAKGALGGYQFHNTEKLEAGQREALKAQILALPEFGGGQSSAAASPANATPPALTAPVGPVSSAPLAPPGIGGRIVGAESGGEPSAVNPNSTASGPGQFIDSTWLETLKKNRPDLAAGKSDAALLAMRTDPAQAGLSRDMTDAYAKQNAGTLSGAGFPVTSGNTYLAHFAGPTGATKILGADPATPVSSLLSPAAIQANPQIANMTAGDIRGWADKQMGGGGSASTPAVGGVASALNAPVGTSPPAPATGAGAPPSPAVSGVAQALSGGQSPSPAAPTAPAGAAGNPNAKAIAAILTNPWADSAMKQALLSRAMAPPEFKTITDAFGGQTPVWANPYTQSITPARVTSATGAGTPADDTSASMARIAELQAKGAPTADLYNEVPQSYREGVKALIEGRAVPTNMGPRSPARSAAIQYAHAIDPSFDEQLIPQRMTFARSMGSSTPNSIGGQKVLLGTSLGHLADVGDSAVDLNNVNGLGSADIAHAANAVKNRTTEQAAKVLALEDKAQKFSGEVGKLYSGSSGGGVHEREETRGRINGNKSPAELAAGLETNRDLILSKLTALEQQRDDAFGKYGKHVIEFQTPQVKATLARIDANIAKLRGQTPAGGATAAPAQAAPTPAAPAGQFKILKVE